MKPKEPKYVRYDFINTGWYAVGVTELPLFGNQEAPAFIVGNGKVQIREDIEVGFSDVTGLGTNNMIARSHNQTLILLPNGQTRIINNSDIQTDDFGAPAELKEAKKMQPKTQYDLYVWVDYSRAGSARWYLTAENITLPDTIEWASESPPYYVVEGVIPRRCYIRSDLEPFDNSPASDSPAFVYDNGTMYLTLLHANGSVIRLPILQKNPPHQGDDALCEGFSTETNNASDSPEDIWFNNGCDTKESEPKAPESSTFATQVEDELEARLQDIKTRVQKLVDKAEERRAQHKVVVKPLFEDRDVETIVEGFADAMEVVEGLVKLGGDIFDVFS